jgi:hypothetical protein
MKLRLIEVISVSVETWNVAFCLTLWVFNMSLSGNAENPSDTESYPRLSAFWILQLKQWLYKFKFSSLQAQLIGAGDWYVL